MHVCLDELTVCFKSHETGKMHYFIKVVSMESTDRDELIITDKWGDVFTHDLGEIVGASLRVIGTS